MKTVRTLAYAALALAYAHTVVGAIVRITGSGMGCGEHWPDCNSALLPAAHDTPGVIEFSHRVLAALLVTALTALVVVAYRRRAHAVFRPAAGALGTAVAAAGLGAVIVMLSLSNRYLVAVHYSLAMFLLGTLVLATIRAGGLAGARVQPGDATARTFRSARAGAGLAFIVVVFGALTANIPGAAQSCQGFPWCRTTLIGGTPLVLQITHRILAFLLVAHLFGVAFGARRRREGGWIVLATRWAFYAVVLQVMVAGALIGLHLPAPLQSLHQAVGTLVWIAAVSSAILAARGMRGVAPAARGALEWSPTA